MRDSPPTYPVTVTLPTAVGFGSNGFYGQGFGYFSTGADVSLPLALIPSSYGSWNTSVGGRYYRLGRTSSFYTNFSDRDQGVFAWSSGLSFKANPNRSFLPGKAAKLFHCGIASAARTTPASFAAMEFDFRFGLIKEDTARDRVGRRGFRLH